MKNFINAVCTCVFVSLSMFSFVNGATEFVCTVMPSGQGGDYTGLIAWSAAVACDIAHSTGTRVFSCAKTGTIADGATVFGNGCTAATGTVVHVTSTQI